MMLEAALEWAKQGFFVFPVRPLGKAPLGGNGSRDATIDPEIITRWWTETPNANIGANPALSGHFALDQDGPRGAATLAALELERGLLPATLTFKTPRGPSNLHYWFKGRCASSTGTDTAGLGPKLDTRGYPNGYVLLPPSRVIDKEKGIDGDYTIAFNHEIAAGPNWIAEVLNRRRERHDAADVDLDLPANLERARSLLRRYADAGDIAVQGAGGDDRTYRLCCEVLNLGVSVPVAAGLIDEIWNCHCVPPWDAEELLAKARNAGEYCQNDAGAWAVKSGAETFADFAAEQPDPIGSPRSRYYPYELSDIEAFEPPDWLIPDVLPKRGTVQITGEQKSFKTFLTLDMVLGIAAGVETFGHTPAAAPVVYIAGENASALVLKHVPAWCMANDQEPSLLPFRVVREMPHAAQPDEMIEFVREIKGAGIGPAVVVIDTATRALRGLDENSAKDMGQFSAACEMIQRELGCTVIIIRHTGKDTARGGRGSNVIEGDFDTILAVDRQKDEQDRKTMFCTLTVREQRNAAEREQPFAFEAQPLGQSLVMRPITSIEHAAATRKEDPFSRQRVGAVLARMAAVGQERALSTYVLAMEMTPPIQGEAAEQNDAAVKRVERALRKRAGTSLSGYTAGEGSALRWFLEPLQSDADAAESSL